MDPISIAILTALLLSARAAGTLRALGATPAFRAEPRPTDFNRRGILPQHYDFSRPQQGAPACPLGRLDGSTLPAYMADCPDGFIIADIVPNPDEQTDAQLLASARDALPTDERRSLPTGHVARQLAERREARSVLKKATPYHRGMARKALAQSPRLYWEAQTLQPRQFKAFNHFTKDTAELIAALALLQRAAPTSAAGAALEDLDADSETLSPVWTSRTDASPAELPHTAPPRNLAECSDADYSDEGAWTDAHLTMAARLATFERRQRAHRYTRLITKYLMASSLDASRYPLRALLGWCMVGFQGLQTAHYAGLTYRTDMLRHADDMKIRRWPQAQRRAELEAMGPQYLFTRAQWTELDNRITETLKLGRKRGIRLRPDNAALYSQWFEQWMATIDTADAAAHGRADAIDLGQSTAAPMVVETPAPFIGPRQLVRWPRRVHERRVLNHCDEL